MRGPDSGRESTSQGASILPVLRCAIFLLSVGFFIGALAYVGYCMAGPYLYGGPRIVCHSATLDRGAVSSKQEVCFRFVVCNEGNQPLTIRKVALGCGSCLRLAKVPREPIAPGMSDVIEVALLTARLRGQIGPDGQVVKRIAVMSNDRIRPSLVLTMRAKVITEQSGSGPRRARPSQDSARVLTSAVGASGNDR